MAFLDGMAAEWAAEDARDQTEAAWEDEKHAAKAERVAEAAGRRRKGKRGQMSKEDAAELADFAWTWADVGARKVDERLKNSEEDHARLVEASTPVIQKRVPAGTSLKGLGELIPVELWLLGVVVFTYLPKYAAIKRENEKEAAEAAAAAKAKDVTPEGAVTARRLNAVP